MEAGVEDHRYPVRNVVLRVRPSTELPLLGGSLQGESGGIADAAAGEKIVRDGGDVRLFRGWLARNEADALLEEIRANAVWVQERRKMYDRFVDVPREQCAAGDGGDIPWRPLVSEVRRRLERLTTARFSYVLFNRYRNGNDSVAWHGDHEVDGIPNPVIASLTLGATRAFDLRPKSDHRRVISIDLEHGDLLIMAGATQDNWEHRVAKNRRIAGERINLTFRQAAVT